MVKIVYILIFSSEITQKILKCKLIFGIHIKFENVKIKLIEKSLVKIKKHWKTLINNFAFFQLKKLKNNLPKNVQFINKNY